MQSYFRILLFILLGSVILTSCRNIKDMIYVRDAVGNDTISRLYFKNTVHILITGDLLFVSITSMDQDVNALFNITSKGSNAASQQTFGSHIASYLNGYQIDSAGYISLPVLGKVKVGGVPLDRVQPVVQKQVDKFISHAVVTVKLLNFKVAVMGEVVSPGIYYNPENYLTVLQAIAMAGGVTGTSAIKEVMVIRTFPKGNKAFMLDLRSKNCFLSDGFYLEPNDYVFVRPSKYKSFALNSGTFSYLLSVTIAMLTIIFIVKK